MVDSYILDNGFRAASHHAALSFYPSGGDTHDLRLSRRLHRLLHQRQRNPGSAVSGGDGNAERRIRTDAGASHR